MGVEEAHPGQVRDGHVEDGRRRRPGPVLFCSSAFSRDATRPTRCALSPALREVVTFIAATKSWSSSCWRCATGMVRPASYRYASEDTSGCWAADRAVGAPRRCIEKSSRRCGPADAQRQPNEPPKARSANSGPSAFLPSALRGRLYPDPVRRRHLRDRRVSIFRRTATTYHRPVRGPAFSRAHVLPAPSGRSGVPLGGRRPARNPPAPVHNWLSSDRWHVDCLEMHRCWLRPSAPG
jgi:hypothetical protein